MLKNHSSTQNKELMAQGVTLMDPDSTYVDVDVEIGQDTIIYPSTWIEGNSKIGQGCKLGPNSHFKIQLWAIM